MTEHNAWVAGLKPGDTVLRVWLEQAGEAPAPAVVVEVSETHIFVEANPLLRRAFSRQTGRTEQSPYQELRPAPQDLLDRWERNRLVAELIEYLRAGTLDEVRQVARFVGMEGYCD